jgi:hypothetical protein
LRLRFTLAFASTCLSASSAVSQTTDQPSETVSTLSATDVTIQVAPELPPCCKLPALTVVELEILDDASSRTSTVGQKLRIRVAEPVKVEGRELIPAGTHGFAEVIQASKARMMGKAGELVIGMPYLELRGQQISLKRLRYGPSTGKGNDTLTTVAVAAVGIAGLLISGGNIDVSSGTRVNAIVSSDTLIALITSESPKGETTNASE